MTGTYDQIPEQALSWIQEGKQVALASVVETWGSAPRPVGSLLAITDQAEMAGSVSGGCVEGAVVAEAIDAFDDGACRVLEYGVSDDEAFAVGLACGGTIRIMVEPIGVGQGPDVDMISQLVAARAERRPAVYAVRPDTWERKLVTGPGDPLWTVATPRLASDKSGFEGDWFLGLHNPPLKMIVVGAVHIAQALVPMARIAGYDPLLIDPRESFGSAARFPGETILHDWPDEGVRAFGLDTRTALVLLTHDPKLDDPALEEALRSDVFYVGALGSTRTHAKRVARMAERGLSEAQIARIHGPIGLDIGAASPSEIAVAILAEMTRVLRQGA